MSQMPALYATILLMTFCPSVYSINVSGSWETGKISRVEIGNHAPLRVHTPDYKLWLHINDIDRLNKCRKIISEAFLGRDTSHNLRYLVGG